jgi:hypothetical protein
MASILLAIVLVPHFSLPGHSSQADQVTTPTTPAPNKQTQELAGVSNHPGNDWRIGIY